MGTEQSFKMCSATYRVWIAGQIKREQSRNTNNQFEGTKQNQKLGGTVNPACGLMSRMPTRETPSGDTTLSTKATQQEESLMCSREGLERPSRLHMRVATLD